MSRGKNPPCPYCQENLKSIYYFLTKDYPAKSIMLPEKFCPKCNKFFGVTFEITEKKVVG